MTPIITATVCAVLSTAICALMAKATNKKLKNIQPQEIDLVATKPYNSGWMTYLLFAGVIMISAGCGYCLGDRNLSWIALVELGSCYLAVLAAAIIDLKTKTIPNYIPAILIIVRLCAFVFELIFTQDALGYMISSIIGCGLCAIVLVIANRMSKGGIGGGDIKLLSAVGFVCGLYVVCATMLLALLACIIISGILLAFKRCSRKDSVPFGPFIWVGFLLICILKLY